MTAIDRNPRLQRAAPLLIREGLSDDVVRSVQRRLEGDGLTTVDSLLDAIHLTGTAPLESPISAVILGECPAFARRDVVNAFRTMDAAVRLVMILEDRDREALEEDRSGAISSGFAGVLGSPLDIEELGRMVGNPGNPASDVSREQADAKPGTPDAGDAVESPPGREEGPPLEDHSEVERVLRKAREHGTTGSPVGTSGRGGRPPGADRGPGERDVRLIRTLMSGGDVVECALDILQAELGTNGLCFLPDEPSGSEASGPLAEAVRAGLALPIPSGERLLGHLVHERPEDRTQLQTWMEWLSHWIVLGGQFEQLEQMAWTDHLTGAGNRRALEQILDTVLESAREELAAVTVMCFDIDDFKRYNDRFGHEAGDHVLRETVRLLRSVIRRGDHVFRVGGDEFVVVFADRSGPRSRGSQPPDSIEKIAERFQQQVGSLRLPQIGVDAKETLSISAGLVTYPWDGRTTRELLTAADRLALRSKRSGKNVITFGPKTEDDAGSDPDQA
ncbi:MAG: GGDEF domain-containing protein [Planctomycetota bacterium]|nr:GGDEF domain-containing protein [Planctomycetota bacterium]